VASTSQVSRSTRLLTPGLGQALAHRRWLRRDLPFPHVVATNVFRPAVYAELERDFHARMDRGELRPMGSYDALGLSFDKEVTGPFALFFSRAWHDLIARLVGVTATGHVSGGLHHHAVGSASGQVHNDLNPGWFADAGTRDDGIVVSTSDLCEYATGRTSDPQIEPRELMRAVAVLFYVGNAPWAPGDGGATGLYRHRDDDVHRPAAIVPPHSNSLLAFECTPWSFHSFIGNRRNPRNCLVTWLHRERHEVLDRWGAAPIVPWAGA
jgi:hypothetical protein